jgi:hypothetical protein
VATLSSTGVKLCDVMPASEPPPQPRWTSAEESAHEVCRRIADEIRREVEFSASLEEVDESANVLFAFAQDALRWAKHNGYASRSALLRVRGLQDLAFAAVLAKSGSRRAKQLQLEASGGDPLTVCVGDLATRLSDLRDVLDPRGELEEYRIPTIYWNSGCGAICADSSSLSRRRKWCETCRKRSSSRNGRRVSEIVRAWGPRECACGSSFTPTRPQRVRCDRCLDGHLSADRSRRIVQPSS